MTTTLRKLFKALAVLTVITGLMAGMGCSKDQRKTTYNLKIKDLAGVSGTVTFTEGDAGTTVAIQLTGAPTTTEHPAHIHAGAAAETGGGIVISLDAVDASGTSTTLVSKLDDGTAISYDQLIAFDGYVNVHLSAVTLGTIIAQGDIGGNALTGKSKSYPLTAVNASGVTGSALFEERSNGTTLVTLALDGTADLGDYPAHIHIGSITTAGAIAVTFNNVQGSTGNTAKSVTNVRKLDDGTLKTYSQLLEFTGYINVHASPIMLGTVLCNGNIGSNVQ